MIGKLTDVAKSVLSEAYCPGPAPESLLTQAEQEAGISIGGEYREFLLSYGAALCRGFEIYGLFDVDEDEPPEWSDVRFAWKLSMANGFDPQLLPFSDDGGDYAFYLAIAESDSIGAGQIAVFGPGLDGVVISRNFSDFVERANDEGIQSLFPK